ncbi:hypothetical protein D9757_005489 [Collybiopsis confluens]|uniref:Glycosyltransferase family 25 protein n=1 Tax=Collybiopsis confluens TaxID=2823264 RepID=A0A8H5M9N7_9AGAR|nr:hypothetical protein D9757_005489 [Collybiopsis confluens]
MQSCLKFAPRPSRFILNSRRTTPQRVFTLLLLFLIISTTVFCDFAEPLQRKLILIFPSAQRLLPDWQIQESEIGTGPLISPPKPNTHSESIYVLSLPHRTDRRRRMESLRKYMGLSWTYINATSSSEEIVSRVLKNVGRLREAAILGRWELERVKNEKSGQRESEALDMQGIDDLQASSVTSSLSPSASLASAERVSQNLKLPFQWPSMFSPNPRSPGRSYSSLKTQILSFLSDFDIYSQEHDSTFSALVSKTYNKSEYLSHFLSDGGSALDVAVEHDTNLQLTGATRDFTLAPYSPYLPYHRILTPARVAVWNSHLNLLKRIVGEGHVAGSASLNRERHITIVLEDDIDMERDIRRRLRQVWKFLPEDWDIVFLGHCWSDESFHPQIRLSEESDLLPLQPLSRYNTIHPSHSPRCTHAYALSNSGASRLIAHLEYPPFAYSRAIDQAYAWLVMSERIKAYSVVGSVIVQVKTGVGGNGDVWHSEGVGEKVSTWNEELLEPAMGASYNDY